ncbi:MAG: hypothetical protein ACR2P0_17850 [Acidimicrobiales bacterium]
MNDEAAAPPPPPPNPAAPAPPTGGPQPPPGTAPSTENPIAVAGIVVSVLALILSVVVVGFLIAIVSLALCIVGYRRARAGLEGKVISIVGIALSVLAMVFSVLGVLFIVALLRSDSEPTMRDGLETTSSNTEHPPQYDVDRVECLRSNSGRIARAEVTITNRSEGTSLYQITVTWDSSEGEIEEVISSGQIGRDETRSFEAVELTGVADFSSCRVTRIERSRFPIL